ncbi:hypothetical protein CKY39_16040 [Variovorax boronicumulans]|uniref:Uncharacterized protein n=1 Tax=Variovorax boronicumulans TaxID=436515 RepID=A0A250DJN4_9BURK|nr:hypothetical protein CKY39_16040 [Variovorax boronicumulans]
MEMRTASDFESTLAAWAVGGIALSIIGTLVSLYLLYLIIRWGVRDGMRDAQRDIRDQREPLRQRASVARTDLPDMRAD